MLQKVKNFVKNNKWAINLLLFLAGALAGILILPTKHIEEKQKTHYEEQINSLKEEHSKEVTSLNDQLQAEVKSNKESQKAYKSKIAKLEVQILDLKTHNKVSYYKVTKPDGTVEIRKVTESDTDQSSRITSKSEAETKELITEIENKWESIYKQKVESLQRETAAKEEASQRKIQDLERLKVVDINQKKFGLEVGITSNKSYYGHATGDILGPLFLGLHGEAGMSQELGAGIGLRF